MNPIIKTLLIRRSNEEGFIIPTVIALGLIMLLIGTINIFKSNDEHITAIVQRDTRKALTAAEAGVAFYRDFMDRYKTIAVHDSTAAANTPSWSDRNGNDGDTGDDIPGITDDVCEFDLDSDPATDAADEFDNTPITGWQDIDGSEGQYRLISYDYDLGTSTGTLIVEGRDENNSEAATARISVDYPIQQGLNEGDTRVNAQRINDDDLNNFDPALWINSGVIRSVSDNNSTNAGDYNLTVNGNVLVTSGNCQLTDANPNLTLTNANQLGNVTATAVDMPVELKSTDANIAGKFTAVTSAQIVSTSASPKTLPLNSDHLKLFDDKYLVAHYVVPNLVLNDGDSIEVNSKTKVVLHVQGNITIDGNVNINQNANNTSDNLQIYLDSNSTITFSGDNSKTINIKAFIHGPLTTVVSPNGQDPTVNITGAVWVNGWDDRTSATNKVTITPDVNYIDYASVMGYDDLNNLLIKPIIYPSSNWSTQAVP